MVYIEYQSVCPFVGIGSPHTISHNRVCPFPWTQGGRSNTPLRVRRWVDPIRTTGKKGWHSVYSVLQLFKWSGLRTLFYDARSQRGIRATEDL
jgi:hypothetical protein